MNFAELNTERLDSIVCGDEEMKKSLLQMFLNTLHRVIYKLNEHVESPSPSEKEWHDLTHELKGAAMNLGFEELGEYCKTIEDQTLNAEQKKLVIVNYMKASAAVEKMI